MKLPYPQSVYINVTKTKHVVVVAFCDKAFPEKRYAAQISEHMVNLKMWYEKLSFYTYIVPIFFSGKKMGWFLYENQVLYKQTSTSS